MDVQAIFGLQFLLSLVVWGALAAWFLSPWLARRPRRAALLVLSIPHAFRHVGMVFLVPGMNAGPLPSEFAGLAAYGDLATGLLALLAIAALRFDWRAASSLVWLFSVVGTVDLLNALRHVDVAPQFGASWYIPTMLVPLLLVTHSMTFRVLLGRASRDVRERNTQRTNE